MLRRIGWVDLGQQLSNHSAAHLPPPFPLPPNQDTGEKWKNKRIFYLMGQDKDSLISGGIKGGVGWGGWGGK